MNIKSFQITKAKGFLVWIAVWIPISFLFPAHVHFPGVDVIAPITTLLLPLKGISAESLSFDFKYVYLPGLIFWIVTFVLLWFLPSVKSKKPD